MTSSFDTIRALFFDLDDTLLDHRGAARCAIRDVYHEYEDYFRPLDVAQVQAAWQAINEAIWEKYSRGLMDSEQLKLRRPQQLIDWAGSMRGFTGAPAAEAVRDTYMARYDGHCALFDGVPALLDQLRGRYTLGIITNGFGSVQSNKLNWTGLRPYFEHVVVSEEVGVHKPDAAIFRIALDRAGVGPGEALYIGDNFLWDVRGAVHAGLAAVWYNPNDLQRPVEYSDVQPAAIARSIPDLAALFGITLDIIPVQ